ncbi:hypothetical protein CANARDRAFT_195439 [[Candida] arabinofermentans NRRL YB-2248]|uniref:C3H1-type domain-containing protein n=1 Tax=[Candida] arabinofermentans NRRL YB-2248 TaxID=983967 RepID=A0A1E4T5R3_9ASCO|nr:hypothetical protein CANARDRAFT_195439 [[Candida] arabinofermentans NRRL YB-2248]
MSPSLSTKVIPIQGTNIVLESEEDIKKWIEERKKNWPTDKRIQARKEELEREQKLMKTMTPSSSSTNQSNSNKRICKFWQKNKKCRHGSSCKFLHSVDGDDTTTTGTTTSDNSNTQQHKIMRNLPNHKLQSIHGIPVQVPKRFTPSINKGKSLHNLLVESERLNNENMVLLDVFKKIMASGLVVTNWDVLKEKIQSDQVS